MTIEFKNIKLASYDELNELVFSGDLYLDCRLTGIVEKKKMDGGETRVDPLDAETRTLLGKAEKYFNELVKVTAAPTGSPVEGWKKNGFQMVLLDRIIKSIEQLPAFTGQLKFDLNLHIAQQHDVVIGKRGEIFRNAILPEPLGVYLSNETYHPLLSAAIAKRVLPHLEEDEMILNSNIPESVLKAAGLKPGQYLKLPAQKPPTQKAKISRGNSI